MEKQYTYEEFRQALDIVLQYQKQPNVLISKKEKWDIYEISNFTQVQKTDKLKHSGLSVRALIRLSSFLWHKIDIPTDSTLIMHLEGISIKELSTIRNLGKKSIEEIKELCHITGVNLAP